MIITIDGKQYSVNPGEMIKDAAERNGIEIPSLCHHSALAGQACCRLCIVEVEENNSRKIVVSCVYPVKEGLVVYSTSEKIKRLRKNILTLIGVRAPKAEGILAEYCTLYNVEPQEERFNADKEEKCILCGLCVKACETVGASAISTMQRGIHKVVSTAFGKPSKDCIGCAACAGVCPAKAISVKESYETREIWGQVFELVVCQSCGKPFATKEMINWLNKKGVANAIYCTKCQRKEAVLPFSIKLQ